MGPAISTSYSDAKVRSQAQLWNNVSTTCAAVTTNTIQDLNINLNDSSVGNITISQVASATASCVIDSNIQSTAQLAAELLQTTSADTASRGGLLNIGMDIFTSISTTEAELETLIMQSIMNNCSATATNTLARVNVNISSSSVGDLTIAQTGDAKASCMISNLAAIDADLRTQIENVNSAGKNRSGGLIGLIVTVMVVVLLLSVLLGVVSSLGKKKGPTGTTGPACIPYACDLLEGAAYVECTKTTLFDPLINCPPGAPVPGAPVVVSPAGPAPAPVALAAPPP